MITEKLTYDHELNIVRLPNCTIIADGTGYGAYLRHMVAAFNACLDAGITLEELEVEGLTAYKARIVRAVIGA